MSHNTRNDSRGNFGNSGIGSGKALIYVLISLAIFMLGLIIALNVVYETRSQITKDDFTNLESYRSDLEETLKETRVLSESENSIGKSNESIRALINSLQTAANPNDAANKEAILKSLNEISNRLLTINTQLGSEQKIVGTRLEKMNEQIKILKDKAKPRNDVGGVLAGVITYFGNTLVALGYPLVILAIVLIFVFSKKGAFRLSDFLGQFKSVKFFSTEFVLNEETKMKAEETLEIYRAQVMREYDLYIQRNSINQIFNNVSEQFIEYINSELGK